MLTPPTPCPRQQVRDFPSNNNLQAGSTFQSGCRQVSCQPALSHPPHGGGALFEVTQRYTSLFPDRRCLGFVGKSRDSFIRRSGVCDITGQPLDASEDEAPTRRAQAAAQLQLVFSLVPEGLIYGVTTDDQPFWKMRSVSLFVIFWCTFIFLHGFAC